MCIYWNLQLCKVRNKFILFLLFIPFWSFSQTTLQGKVMDTLKSPLVAAQVLVYDSAQQGLIAYAITDAYGNYRLDIQKYFGPAILTAQSMGHKQKIVSLYLPGNNLTLTKNFILSRKETPLAEVVIKTEASPIEVKKDTVTYNVSKFTNGSEEVVNDLLKKLPGIDVGEDGVISYHGKQIDKVLIENDNLLEDYKVLTKNLSANTIKKVQAIENYAENKNLKGIVNDDETVLNLQLKDNVKAKPYGNIKLAYGYKNFYEVNMNLLGVNKKVKYYLLGASNNIGINSAPNDYISLKTNIDKVRGPDYPTSMEYQFPNLKPRRVNFNHLYFGSSNLLLKLGDKLKVRNNLYFTKDRNLFNKISSTTYLLSSNNFSLDEIQSLVREPIIGKGLIEAQYALTKHSDIDYKIKYNLKQVKYNGSQNTIESFFNESLQNNEQYVHQNLDYTNRLNNHNALLINTQYFYNRKSQEYYLLPFPDSIPFHSVNNASELFQQNVVAEHRFHAMAKYIGIRNSLNFQVKMAYENKQQSVKSNLYSISNDRLQEVENPYGADDRMGLQNFELGVQNKNTWNKWKLSYGLSVHYKTFLFENPISLSQSNHTVFLSPLLRVNFKSENSKVSLLYSSERRYPSINDLFSGYILTDYRTFARGTGNGADIKTQVITASYGYRDFQKLLMFYARLTYLNQDKTYGSKILVNKYYTIMEKAIVPGNKNFIFSSMVSKFLPFMYSTLRLNIQLSQMQYYNYVNQSYQRHNKLFYGVYNFELTSGWKKFFNFSIGVKYKSYNVRLENSSVVSRTRNMISHQNIILDLSKKVRVYVQNEQFFYEIKTPNLKTYYFLDAKVKYTIVPNKFSIQLTGNNLLGNNTFDEMNVSDYMVQTTQYNMLPRQIMLNVSFRF